MAGKTESATAEQALNQLCRTYWYPLYAFIRRKGHSPHDAQDLTQAFFARLLEKNYVAQADRERGRFRTYLLAALTHFLADEWDKARRLKRGGGREFVSFNAASAEEQWFDQGMTLMHSFWMFEAERAFRWCLKLDTNKRGLFLMKEHSGASERNK